MIVAIPSNLFGSLFVAVQERRLFADSKTFADAVPLRSAADIMSNWADRADMNDEELRAFVVRNFDLPTEREMPARDRLPLADHIHALWDDLTRETVTTPAGSSALSLPRPYVVPGGRFRELYYWDSYFTMLGLARSGRQDLVEDMIADFGSLIERYGHIPNGTRSYYLSRSHPPFFHLMAGLSRDDSVAGRQQRLAWMTAEHSYWMSGADEIAPGGEHARVVRLKDGVLLNRYWDDSAQPRDESWIEDVDLAREAPGRAAADVWRDLRAAAESGWDFSSRWLGDGRTLATIRTTRIVPVDLNSLLYGLERSIAGAHDAAGDADLATRFSARAAARQAAIETHLWSDASNHYADYDLDAQAPIDRPSAAMAFPLFAGIARDDRAKSTAEAIGRLLAPGGLNTSDIATGQQWDAPNGWAPLQWIAVAGLARYGEDRIAAEIAARWLATVERQYLATGQLFEKYDVETGLAGGGGEYAVATGFGWTNGVTLEMMAMQPERER
ncbi:alpha,alpha-trehalase TreA [Sphingomonas aliaeris]|uniref:Alpha,alpha-trehalase TreA n=1 Tax=Sphingomonas aliaeris TaxID=2759526 RepID=A0A974NXQ3_9SPHN|nr:alpha,alpha-trehalase TreA [Sphingomonas aliaeris]QQV78979.1 alpha,alpha-trehalase TreA [Sphingomonas aliaeris]